MKTKIFSILLILLLSFNFIPSTFTQEQVNDTELINLEDITKIVKDEQAIINATDARGANYEIKLHDNNTFTHKIYSKNIFRWDDFENKYVKINFNTTLPLPKPDGNVSGLVRLFLFKKYAVDSFTADLDFSACFNPNGGGNYWKQNLTAIYFWKYSSSNCAGEAAGNIVTRGVVEWNITSLPDLIAVSNTIFKYHGALNSAGVNIRGIYAMANQPSLTSAQSVYDDARDGSAYVPDEATFPVVAVTQQIDLGTDADNDIETAVLNDWFAIGMSSTEVTNNAGGAIWDSSGGANPVPTLEVTYTIPPPRTIGELPSAEDIINNDTTTSNIYEDVDDLSVNITTAETANLLIMASIQTESNESAVASYRLVFDGVNYQGLSRQVSTLSGNVILTDLVHNKSAGNYELKLQHNISNGLLSTINASIYVVQLHNGNGLVPSNDTFVNTDSTTSSTLTDITNLSTEITLARTSYIWVSMSWSGQMSVANQQGNFTIDIDGQTLETRFRKWGTANQWGALSLITRTNDKIPNGTHTVKGVWQRTNAGTLSGLNFSLVVIAGEANDTVAEFEISKKRVVTDTTSSTSIENIDDLTYDVSLPNTTHIIGFLSLDTETNTNNKNVYFTININGTDQEILARGHSLSGSSIASIGQVVRTNNTLPVGNANLTGRWFTDAATVITGENIILTSFVLFTEDTGTVDLTVFRHTGLTQILIGGDPQNNGTVVMVTVGDTVNVTMLEDTNFDFFYSIFDPFLNHTHTNPHLQIMNVDVTMNSYALSIGAVSDQIVVIPNNQDVLGYIFLSIIVASLIAVGITIYIRKT